MGVIKAELKDIDKCVEILFVPEIGRLYFPKKEMLRDEVEESIKKGEIFIDKSENESIDTTDGSGSIRGVLWYVQKGVFNTFPYLHMISVKEIYRGRGVGNKLMEFFEQNSLLTEKKQIRTKVFLLVNERNISAQKFYYCRGYEEIGRFENLFRKGLTEILLMKKVRLKKE